MSAAEYEQMMDKIMGGYFSNTTLDFNKLIKEENLTENFKNHILPILRINLNSIEENGKKHYIIVKSTIAQILYKIILDFRTQLAPLGDDVGLNQNAIVKVFDNTGVITDYYLLVNEFYATPLNKSLFIDVNQDTLNKYFTLYFNADKFDKTSIAYEASFKTQVFWNFIKDKKLEELI